MAKNQEIIYTDEESGDLEKLDSKSKKLRKKLKEYQKEKEEYLSQAQRARADLINYRHRQEETVIPGAVAIGKVSVIQKILPVLDSLEAGAENHKEIEPIKDQFFAILKQNGVKEIKAIGKEFNPHHHEAIEMVDSKKKSGIIISEIQKGYILDDKILRISKVRVSK